MIRLSRPALIEFVLLGGASHNLACILQVYTDPVCTLGVWVVEPPYFLAFRIFEDSCFHGNKLQGVPADKEGVDISYLEAAMTQAEAAQSGQEVQP
jgi:DNA-binding transcriptional MocR family regulator